MNRLPSDGPTSTKTPFVRPAIKVFLFDLLSIVPYYVGHLAKELRTTGLQVEVGAITYHLDRGYFAREGLRNHPGPLDLAGKLSFRSATPRRAAKLVECCINLLALGLRMPFSRPDILHVQYLPLLESGLPVELWILRLAKVFGVRLVHTVHNILPQDGGDRYRTAYTRVYRMADRLICHNDETKEQLVAKFGVSPDRISVIPHGPLFGAAPPDSGARCREKLKLAPSDVLVVYHGIISPYKGVPLLVDAWRRVQQSHPNARLLIVGSGDPAEMQKIEERVSAYGLTGSVCLDFRFVSELELTDLLAAADVLVYPYREITTSGALMTGINFGKPIVATRLPLFEATLQHGETALLVPRDDEAELGQALLSLIGNQGLRERLAAAIRRLPRPSWSEIAAKTACCYELALGRAVGSAGDPAALPLMRH